MSKCLGRGNCISLLNFFFDILWSSTYLNYVPKFESEDLVYNYFVTSQSESHSVPNMDFFVKLSLILCQLQLSREEFTTFNSEEVIFYIEIYAIMHKRFNLGFWNFKSIFQRMHFLSVAKFFFSIYAFLFELIFAFWSYFISRFWHVSQHFFSCHGFLFKLILTF